MESYEFVGPCECGHVQLGYKLQGGVLSKTVRASVHQLRRPPAWAIQQEVWTVHMDEIQVVEIVDEETGKVYRTSAENFGRNARLINRGYGYQFALPLPFWNTQPEEATQPALL